MRKERSFAVIALALFCCFLVGSAQPVHAVIPLIPFALGMLAGSVLVGWLLGVFTTPYPGISPLDLLQNFYSAKVNEFRALTTGLNNTAEALEGVSYYLSRKATTTAQMYINESTFPANKVLNVSGILTEASNEYFSYIQSYQYIFDDIRRYTSASLTGDYASLTTRISTVGSYDTNLKTESSEIRLMRDYQFRVPSNTPGTVTFNIVANNSRLIIRTDYDNTYQYGTLTIQDCNNGSTVVNTATYVNQVYSYTLSGHYFVTLSILGKPDSWEQGIITDAFIYNISQTTYQVLSLEYSWIKVSDVINPSNRAVMWNSHAGIRFTDGTNNFTISNTNKTTFNLETLRQTLDTALMFAKSNAQSHWQLLRSLGYTDPSQIPPQYVIPPTDVAFISNEDMVNLSYSEIYAMYIAYLKALSNFFNSSTWQQANLTQLLPQNVSFINVAIKVNGTIYRNNTAYAGPSQFYLQVFADMVLRNDTRTTLNQSGIVYDIVNNMAYSYQPNDEIQITALYVKMPNGEYQQVDTASISSTTIESYVHYSDTYTPTPTTTTPSKSGLPWKWILLGGAVFVLLVVFSPMLNEMGKQWARTWR